ncbi:MAG: mechanosensitive ion channel, partial [Armatimonadetes bacterium]|nr:mechanosensitive ion channel [Armatimonadota bacterium]
MHNRRMARVPFLSRSGSHRRWWVLAAALVALVGPASARRAGPEPAPVVFDKQTLFILYSRVGSFPAQDRARTVAERLLDIANDRSIQPGDIAVKHGPVGSDIVVGDRPISHITDGDAAALGLPREALAERYADGIRRAITVYRAERSVPTIIRGALYALLATLTIVFVLWLFGLIFGRLAAGIEALKRTHIRPLRIQQSEVLTPDQVGAAFLWVLDAVRLVALAALVYAYLTIAFGFFPWTEGYAATLLGYVMGQVRTIGKAIVAEIPNVLFVVLIIVIARYVLKAIRFLFVEIERGAIGFAGFDREWAMPTFKLVRLLVVALAVIAAFPYVPGSKSPAFQGVSVLLGLIFSLGSSGAVANLVAGVVLTYMRPFRIGDRVQVADTVGDVVEKSMLV